jgi:CO dehydrogenase/acetyl-CoA synthase alpha subunit
VVVYTCRAASDTALKPLFISGVGTGSREINGPCSVEIATRAGRKFQVECIAGSASIAFED